MAEVQPDPRGFVRAAEQRLAAGRALLDAKFPFDAIYLFGYVAEMALKVAVMVATPQNQWQQLRDEEFAGRRGHNFDRLRQLLADHRQHLPLEMLEALRRVSSNWTPQMRYQSHAGNEGTAIEVAAAAEALLQWARRRI